MAKIIKNLLDFTGGVNTRADKRDISETEATKLDGFIDTTQGSLSLGGVFVRPGSMDNDASGFPGDYVSEGIANLYYVNPMFGFKVCNQAAVTKNSSDYTFTLSSDNNHCLTPGTPIVCYGSEEQEWNGKSFLVTSTTADGGAFKVTVSDHDAATLPASGNVMFAVNADLPTAVLLSAVVFDLKAPTPMPTLLLPVLLAYKAA